MEDIEVDGIQRMQGLTTEQFQVMEEKTLHALPLNKEEIIGIRRERVDSPPGNYILKIESFSQLAEALDTARIHKYESEAFKVGAYKWKLVLYPNGDTERNGNNHISLYLAMDQIPTGCHVDVKLKFFVHDQIQHKYLTIHDSRVKRYNIAKRYHGFEQLLSLSNFKDSSNGYLVDDCCVFGVEVQVLNFPSEGENFKLIKEPQNGTFVWKIDKFSKLNEEYYYSKVFTVACYKWKLLLYPKGIFRQKSRSLSIYLNLVGNNIANPVRNVYAEFKLSVEDQIHGKHKQHTGKIWFKNSSSCLGFEDFMNLTDLHASNGYLVKNKLIVVVKIDLISAVEALS